MTTSEVDPPVPPAAPRQPVPLWLLALFTLSGPIAMHMLVPALPHAARDLNASVGAMQLTISLYILGMALGQLGYGPLSDRFGRRPVLTTGLVLYTVAGLAAALVPNVQALVSARLFQALGGGAGLALSRAIVRDTAGPADVARRLALMNLMVTLGPGLAPVIGGVLAASFGWRTIFIALGTLGLLNLMLLWRLLPETREITGTVSAATIAKDYRELLRSPSFIGYAIGGGCATTSMYAFVGAAPFILVDELHRPSYEVGLYLGLLVAGFSIGTILATRLIPGVAIGKLLARSSLVSALAAFFFLGATLSSHLNVALAVIPMIVFTIGAGISSPTALSQALGINPRIIGSASGLYGCAQMGIGALCAGLVGIGRDPALAAGIVLASASLIGQLAFWIAARKRPAT
ncbi:MAG TPA: multidrug effflux MFS transporter [Hyphomicrobiaceae bacterium]|nr:multidrug effflux MFS transporter [Hyphomicrobiaceae bacterium]